MRIVSFNINGLRARPHQLAALKEKYDPDIIALQEIKVSDEDFPPNIPGDLGFNYYNYGQKGFHGVAIFSKEIPINTIKADENKMILFTIIFQTLWQIFYILFANQINHQLLLIILTLLVKNIYFISISH